MKSFTTLVFLFLFFSSVRSQATLTIAECYERAEANYPLIRQRELLHKTKFFSIENASKGYLPQITVGGQATYQSEVTRIPIEMPGVKPLDKDQYRVFGEISQTLYHGGLVKQQERSEEFNGVVEEQKLDIELYQLRDRVNELFFGILLLQEQIRQSELLKDDIDAALEKTEAAIANGTAIRSASDVLRAELLRTDQRVIEFQSAKRAYSEILGLFINRSIGDGIALEKPEIPGTQAPIHRPELGLFEFQKRAVEINRALLSARKKPKIDLFLQGGYGKPGLNMLENEFDFYYLGGVRLSWLISGFYTFGKEKEILNIRQQSLDVRKETFLFNTGLALRQQQEEINKLHRLMEVDDQIISLRTRVKETASVQLEQGVISPSDYVREVNAADQARQNRVLHETQLLMVQAKYQFTTGY